MASEKLSDAQLDFLRRVYEHFHATGRWIPEHQLHRALAQDRSLYLLEAGKSISDRYVLFHADGQNAIALRLAGIRVSVGECVETDDFVRLLQLAAERYQQKGVSSRLEVRELSERGFTPTRLARLDVVFEKSEFLAGPSGAPDNLVYDIHDGIGPYLDVSTIDGFLAIYHQRREGLRSSSVPKHLTPPVDRRQVFLVHGRNAPAQRAMSVLLRAFGLEPVLFRDALPGTAKATPYIGDILKNGFERTYASVVLMTPDDFAQLRPEYLREGDPEYERTATGQARPNVLFEAGLAWSSHSESRVLLVELGRIRPLTDLSGLHVVHFDDSPQIRREIGLRLQAAGCPVKWDEDWLSAGDFASVLSQIGESRPPSRAASNIEILFDPSDQQFEIERWAEQPHRLFGKSFRLGIRNNTRHSIDGVRLVLADVEEQPYRPVYLKNVGDLPPFSASKEGVRVDAGGVTFFELVTFNHENPSDEIQFAYATIGEPNLRPAGTYTLHITAEARNEVPRTATFRVEGRYGIPLNLSQLEEHTARLKPTTGAGPDVRLEVINDGPPKEFAVRARIVARQNDKGGQPLRTGAYQLPWVHSTACVSQLATGSSSSVRVAKWQIWPGSALAQVDLVECTAAGETIFETSRWNVDATDDLPVHVLQVDVIAASEVLATARFRLRPSKRFGPLELVAVG